MSPRLPCTFIMATRSVQDSTSVVRDVLWRSISASALAPTSVMRFAAVGRGISASTLARGSNAGQTHSQDAEHARLCCAPGQLPAPPPLDRQSDCLQPHAVSARSAGAEQHVHRPFNASFHTL